MYGFCSLYSEMIHGFQNDISTVVLLCLVYSWSEQLIWRAWDYDDHRNYKLYYFGEKNGFSVFQWNAAQGFIVCIRQGFTLQNFEIFHFLLVFIGVNDLIQYELFRLN